MKKFSLLFMMLALSVALILTGCSEETSGDEIEESGQEEPSGGDSEQPSEEAPSTEERSYDDGTYRGTYRDQGQEQVGIQFEIKDGVFENLRFRQLAYSEDDFRAMEEGEELFEVMLQYEEAIAYLVGKPIEAMYDLYSPGDFVEDVDGFSGSTIRSNKVFSAIQDGLNRGLYTADHVPVRAMAAYDDGTYRGTYRDQGQEQVGIQFVIENNEFTNVRFRQLAYSDDDFRAMEEGEELFEVMLQYEQAAEYLVGKPLEVIFDLHSPGDFVDDIDGYSGATIRANKIFSAIMDGLNRGLYSGDDIVGKDMPVYEDGTYRGTYGDQGQEQVGIQFVIENNEFTNVRFRQLAYSDDDFRAMEEGEELFKVMLQYEQAVEYLVGKPLEAIYDLHSPENFVDDVDGFSGATIRSNKIFSAIIDGLNRGVYSY